MENQEKVEVLAINFGLEEHQGLAIKKQFIPALEQRDILTEMYMDIISGEFSPENCKRAKDVCNKLVKVRTHIGRIHKVEKAFYRAGGLFCDALKNKQTEPIIIMESDLKEFANHYENIEKERILKLNEERKEELVKYELTDIEIPSGLGEMETLIWDNYLSGVELAFNAKKEAEKKAEDDRIENERVEKLYNERKESILPYWSFVPNDNKDDDFGLLTDLEWKERFEWSISEKNKYDKEQEEIRVENERLHIELKQKERKSLAEQKERERLANIESEKLAKIQAENEAKLKTERLAREKAENEIAKQKADQEQKENEEKERLVKEELTRKRIAKAKYLQSDKDKFNSYIDDLRTVKFPEIKSEEIANHAKGFLSEMKMLVDKYKL